LYSVQFKMALSSLIGGLVVLTGYILYKRFYVVHEWPLSSADLDALDAKYRAFKGVARIDALGHGIARNLGVSSLLNIRLVSLYEEGAHESRYIFHADIKALQGLLQPMVDALGGGGVTLVLHTHSLAIPDNVSGRKAITSVDDWVKNGYSPPTLASLSDLDIAGELSVFVVATPNAWGWSESEAGSFNQVAYIDAESGVVVIKQASLEAGGSAAGVLVRYLRELLDLPGQVPRNSSLALSPDEIRMLQETMFHQHVRLALGVLRAASVLHGDLGQLYPAPAEARALETVRACVDDLLSPGSASSRHGADIRAWIIHARECARVAEELDSDPGLMPQLFLPVEHHLALYGPFWIPLLIPLFQAAKALVNVERNKIS